MEPAMTRPRWWLTAGLVYRKRLLMRSIETKRQEIDRLNDRRLDFERELAEVDAAIDAAKDDGVDLLAEWEKRNLNTKAHEAVDHLL